MNSELKDKYISNRVQDQINWFDKKSTINKRHHYWFAGFSVVGAILCASSLCASMSIVSSILSLLVAISIAIDNFFHFREKWLTYRMACESLKSLLYRYNATDVMEWDSFVSEVEHVIAQANDNWHNQMEKSEK